MRVKKQTKQKQFLCLVLYDNYKSNWKNDKHSF